MYENLVEFFAIMKATEKLEKAYTRDVILPEEYELECQELIAHFKALALMLKDPVPSIKGFHENYKMDSPAVMNSLVTSGVPATVGHGPAAAMSSGTSAAAVAKFVQNFITAMDSLKLNMAAVDLVHPLHVDLSSINKLNFSTPAFEGKTKMNDWILKVSEMVAANDLNEQQGRQLHFDLEPFYNSNMAALPCDGT